MGVDVARRRAYQREYYARPEIKEKRKKYWRKYLEMPGVKERRKEYIKNYNHMYYRKMRDALREVEERKKNVRGGRDV